MKYIFCMSYDLVSILLSAASVLIGVVAALVAKSSLSQAKQVADRDKRDWRQRKWFDLYLQMNEAYDFFDEFQTKHKGTHPTSWGLQEEEDWNHLMNLIRKVHAMAMVFPPNPVIDKLVLATAVFSDKLEALSENRLKTMLDAMDDLRMQAIIDPNVLSSDD
jgi:hypothetical protein